MKKNKQRPHPAHPAATNRRKFQTSGIAGDKGSKGKASMPAILSVFWQFRMEESRQVRRRCARISRFDRKFSLGHERRPPYLTLRDEGEGFLTIRARARGRGLAAPSLFASMRGRITWPSPPKITGTSSASSSAVVLDLEACPRRSRSRASCRRDLPLDFARSAPKRRGASAHRAFSGGQLPSSHGRNRQPRWPTGYRLPGTAAAPRAPRTTTATARTARAAAASPVMMTAAAQERRTAARARIADVPATRPRVARRT